MLDYKCKLHGNKMIVVLNEANQGKRVNSGLFI